MTIKNPTEITDDFLREMIRQELPDLIKIRHDLHANPELGYEENRTAEMVCRELETAGVSHRAGLAGGTGILGHIPAGDAPAIGLRADMDALPIQEESDLPYVSMTTGKMHACGHDGHTTILLGAARVLGKLARESSLPRPITFLFQPAEEGGAGGRRMVEDGCVDGRILGPPLSMMFGLHGWPYMPLGSVGTRPGPLLAAADEFQMTIHGIGGHAALPHKGRDPIVCSAALISALQNIAARNVDPLDSVVVSTTQIHGGTTHNIIPDSVQLGGTVRTLRRETKTATVNRLQQIAEGIGKAFDCRIDVEYIDGYPVTENDVGAVDVFERVATESLGSERVARVTDPIMGGEDFSFYCQALPSCFFFLGLLPPAQDSMPGLHQPTFDFNDDALPIGIEMFCHLALTPPHN